MWHKIYEKKLFFPSSHFQSSWSFYRQLWCFFLNVSVNYNLFGLLHWHLIVTKPGDIISRQAPVCFKTLRSLRVLIVHKLYAQISVNPVYRGPKCPWFQIIQQLYVLARTRKQWHFSFELNQSFFEGHRS